jgi:hypothetical protein
MIAATATCAAAATEATAQSQPLVLNNQLQLGDVVAGQTLNVVDASDQVTVSNSAVGVSLAGGSDGHDGLIVSAQEMRGDTRARADLTLGGDTDGVVTVTNQARGSYLGATVNDAEVAIDAAQTTSGEVRVATEIGQSNARLLAGGTVSTGAIGNTVAVGGERVGVLMGLDQRAEGSVRASTFAATQYIPAEAEFSSQALANAVQTSGEVASTQRMGVRQRSSGALVEAATSANAGNAWDLAGRANAGANQILVGNQGGSIVVETDQGNTSDVRAASVVTAYDYGQATSYARAAANEVQAGNNDRYVEIDNTQVNSGGVEASARFAGTQGYDVYLGAEAVGNSVTGYACSTCTAYLEATNSQINNGDVTATVAGTVNGQGRAVIGSATATGNSATFYVSRPGG